MRKKLVYRPLLALTLALVVLLFLGSVAKPPAAQPPLAPPEPTVSAAAVGRNEAWYIEQGYADSSTDLPPVEPAQFPSPTPPTWMQVNSDLNHHFFLPLVEKTESDQREEGGESEENAEARALWVTRWDYSSVADVETLIENAAGAGFNIVLFQVRGTADAFYASSLEPWAARLSGTLGVDPGWDPLQTAVNAAHRHNIELHAHINVYPVWVGTERPAQNCYPQHLYWTLSDRYWGVDPGFPSGAWRVYGSDYEPMMLNSHYLYATPAIPDMDAHIAAVANDIVSRYPVDGVHLDLVRYPGPGYSYDPTTEAALAQGNVSRADWQRQRVTQLVSHVYSEAILPRSQVQLSAAVWPVYKNHWGWNATEGYSDVFQDSQGWVRSGVIDAILPMIYPVDVSQSSDAFTKDHFSLLTSDFLDNDGERHVFPGISAQYHNFDEIAQRIAIARDLGAPGHAIFSARLVIGDYPCADRLPCHDPYWDDFAAGPYADPARVPALPWRQ